MRKDIYVVQKTAEEGKHLEDWCIQNDVTVNMNYGLGFNPEWNCFAYFNSIDAFCKNYELSSCKLNMQEVTIEEFKRLQLESLGKTETTQKGLKVGDWVLIKLDQFHSLGEGDKFNDKKGVPLCIEEIVNKCVFKLSGINCNLCFSRFEKCDPPTSDLKIGDYITVTDENISKEFKMIGKIISVKDEGESDENNIRGLATFINIKELEFEKEDCWCYIDNQKRKYRKSTEEEIQWLEECIKQNKYIAFKDLPKQKQNNRGTI